MSKKFGMYHLEIGKEKIYTIPPRRETKYTVTVMQGESVAYDCIFLFGSRNEARAHGMKWIVEQLEKESEEAMKLV
jgi:hypothetical protein